ncbi:hypothetical protein BCL57_003098 [Agromyces flavus]|uniref:Uncharacterized protein n=1 Tax=Agromyces flavus TaxID=589382 RepID=A0ABT1KPU5_9MICO|nr:hypothetical protein [Agromyces flavus]
MSDAVTPFTMLGSAGAVCAGDVCEIPPAVESGE